MKELGLVDYIIDEPAGSAYRDVELAARNIHNALTDSLESLEKMSLDKLLDTRYQRLMSYGKFIEA